MTPLLHPELHDAPALNTLNEPWTRRSLLPRQFYFRSHVLKLGEKFLLSSWVLRVQCRLLQHDATPSAEHTSESGPKTPKPPKHPKPEPTQSRARSPIVSTHPHHWTSPLQRLQTGRANEGKKLKKPRVPKAPNPPISSREGGFVSSGTSLCYRGYRDMNL